MWSKNKRIILLLGIFWWTHPLLALSTDRSQPVQIEANTATIDNAKGLAIYEGNVIVIQGSIRLTADKVTIDYTPKQELQKVLAVGNPAHFKQTPDGGKPDMLAQARQMEYFADQGLLQLTIEAQLQQGQYTATAPRIIYDIQKDTFKAEGDKAEKAEGETPSARVTVTVPPRQPVPQKSPKK